MTPADESAFIALWTEGLEIAVIAERLGRPNRLGGPDDSRSTESAPA